MAGGDYALIKSVEGFEDFAPFGRRQIADLGVTQGDMLFAITEGGETSFVIGTAWEALEKGATVAFVYNNPDEVLRGHVRRSREVLDEPRIRKVNLTTGPMAITGSTRMQATSIELLAVVTVLEMTLRELLARERSPRRSRSVLFRARGDAGRAPRGPRGAGERQGSAGTLWRGSDREENVYRRGARTSYFADTLAVDVLTDTTERSPTFCTPSVPEVGRRGGRRVVGVPVHAGPVHGGGLDPAAPARPAVRSSGQRGPAGRSSMRRPRRRQGSVLGEIGRTELMRFRIGLDGGAHRPVRAGDGVTAVVAEADLPLLDEGAPFAEALVRAREAGAATAVIGVGRRPALDRLASTPVAKSGDTLLVTLEVPPTPFLLDPLTRVGVKMLLNALSTCTMVRLGRVLGNRMIWVVPSNLKLIDRSIRYIRTWPVPPTKTPARRSSRSSSTWSPGGARARPYPAPVGVASMHLRHGLSLEEAEARLARESRRRRRQGHHARRPGS